MFLEQFSPPGFSPSGLFFVCKKKIPARTGIFDKKLREIADVAILLDIEKKLKGAST